MTGREGTAGPQPSSGDRRGAGRLPQWPPKEVKSCPPRWGGRVRRPSSAASANAGHGRPPAVGLRAAGQGCGSWGWLSTFLLRAQTHSPRGCGKTPHLQPGTHTDTAEKLEPLRELGADASQSLAGERGVQQTHRAGDSRLPGKTQGNRDEDSLCGQASMVRLEMRERQASPSAL